MHFTLRAKRTVLLALLAMAGLVALAMPLQRAAAADATKPTCPLLAEDKSGDQVDDPSGLGLQDTKGPDTTDIVGYYFNQGADGKVTANIVVKNLDSKAVPDPPYTGGYFYYAFWKDGDVVQEVHAEVSAAGTTYVYGTFDPSTGAYTDDGTTTGKFFDGENGVVQIDVPDAQKLTAGKTVKATYAEIDGIEGANDLGGLNIPFDVAPESKAGPTYTVGPCVAPDDGSGTPPPPATTPPPSSTPPPSQSTPPATLPFRAAATLGSAKKANKKKALKFKVNAEQPITSLVVVLKASNGKGATFASGKLARVNGVATLKLKLKRKLKKGKYALFAKGKVDGKPLKSVQQVLVKK